MDRIVTTGDNGATVAGGPPRGWGRRTTRPAAPDASMPDVPGAPVVVPLGGDALVGRADSEGFLEACGSAGPLRLGFADEGRPGGSAIEPRVFRRPAVILGRDPGADLVLESPEVSRQHAYLQLIAGRLFCVDLRSRTGVRWEGGPRPSGWVGPGESIRIGPFRIRFEGGPGPWAGPSTSTPDLPPPTSRAFAQPGLVEATLEHLDPEPEWAPWRVSRALVLLGRSSACKVRLPGPGISRFHCGLVRTPAGIWAVDLLGQGGILVNGGRVRASRLDDEDELRAGPHRIGLRIWAAAARTGQLPALPSNLGARHGLPAAPADLTTDPPLPSLVPEVGSFLANRLELADPVLAPLLQEFGQMQQQMAEQFQQALMMMCRMFSGMHQDQMAKFSGMHQDQMALIREELARIHQLTEEQRALQAALSATPPAPTDRPALRLVSAEPQLTIPKTASAPDGSRTGAPAGDEGADRSELTPDSGVVTAKQAPGGSSRRQADPNPNPEEIHSILARRLAAIQEERQGRWQKLLGAVMGKGISDALS